MAHFEIIVNGHSYGVYEEATEELALLAFAKDAGYQDLEALRENVAAGKNAADFGDIYKIKKIVVSNVHTDVWDDGETPAVFFDIDYDGENISTLEWLTEDGELECKDSHLKSTGDFSFSVNEFLREHVSAALAA